MFLAFVNIAFISAGSPDHPLETSWSFWFWVSTSTFEFSWPCSTKKHLDLVVGPGWHLACSLYYLFCKTAIHTIAVGGFKH